MKVSHNRLDLTGRVFGRLTVQKLSHINPKRQESWWLCLCECGGTKTSMGYSLTGGLVESCGCLHKERTSMANTKHGGSDTPEYRVWAAMWQRCTNTGCESYTLYKDRTPPERWKDFSNFISDMGARPSPKHSIERVDNAKPYSPENCKWATPVEQSRNRSNALKVELNGKSLTLKEACVTVGLKYTTVYTRIRSGKTVEQASENKLATYLPKEIQ